MLRKHTITLQRRENSRHGVTTDWLNKRLIKNLTDRDRREIDGERRSTMTDDRPLTRSIAHSLPAATCIVTHKIAFCAADSQPRQALPPSLSAAFCSSIASLSASVRLSHSIWLVSCIYHLVWLPCNVAVSLRLSISVALCGCPTQ